MAKAPFRRGGQLILKKESFSPPSTLDSRPAPPHTSWFVIFSGLDGEHLEEMIPGGAFPTVGQARSPELAELEQVPELEGQPAGAPLARALEAELTQAHLYAEVGGVRGERSVGGKEGEGLRALRGGIEGSDGAGPGGRLGVVDLAQIEQRPIEDAAVGDAALFHEGPVTVLLAVFAAGVTTMPGAGICRVKRFGSVGDLAGTGFCQWAAFITPGIVLLDSQPLEEGEQRVFGFEPVVGLILAGAQLGQDLFFQRQIRLKVNLGGLDRFVPQP